MPKLGYGVYQVSKEECTRCVLDAIEAGYRLIDTAQSYFNEAEVGEAIARCGVPRDELFITTKVWIDNYGYEKCRQSVLESMRKLRVDYLDLILLHQPFANYYGAYLHWRSCMQRVRSGLSVFPTSTPTVCRISVFSSARSYRRSIRWRPIPATHNSMRKRI